MQERSEQALVDKNERDRERATRGLFARRQGERGESMHSVVERQRCVCTPCRKEPGSCLLFHSPCDRLAASQTEDERTQRSIKCG